MPEASPCGIPLSPIPFTGTHHHAHTCSKPLEPHKYTMTAQDTTFFLCLQLTPVLTTTWPLNMCLQPALYHAGPCSQTPQLIMCTLLVPPLLPSALVPCHWPGGSVRKPPTALIANTDSHPPHHSSHHQGSQCCEYQLPKQMRHNVPPRPRASRCPHTWCPTQLDLGPHCASTVNVIHR